MITVLEGSDTFSLTCTGSRTWSFEILGWLENSYDIGRHILCNYILLDLQNLNYSIKQNVAPAKYLCAFLIFDCNWLAWAFFPSLCLGCSFSNHLDIRTLVFLNAKIMVISEAANCISSLFNFSRASLSSSLLSSSTVWVPFPLGILSHFPLEILVFIRDVSWSTFSGS